jgi:hypothetical protein
VEDFMKQIFTKSDARASIRGLYALKSRMNSTTTMVTRITPTRI